MDLSDRGAITFRWGLAPAHAGDASSKYAGEPGTSCDSVEF